MPLLALNLYNLKNLEQFIAHNNLNLAYHNIRTQHDSNVYELRAIMVISAELYSLIYIVSNNSMTHDDAAPGIKKYFR